MEYTTDRMSCLRKLGETQEWLRFYEKQLERTSRPTTKKGDMLAISMYFGMIGYTYYTGRWYDKAINPNNVIIGAFNCNNIMRV